MRHSDCTGMLGDEVRNSVPPHILYVLVPLEAYLARSESRIRRIDDIGDLTKAGELPGSSLSCVRHA